MNHVGCRKITRALSETEKAKQKRKLVTWPDFVNQGRADSLQVSRSVSHTAIEAIANEVAE